MQNSFLRNSSSVCSRDVDQSFEQLMEDADYEESNDNMQESNDNMQESNNNMQESNDNMQESDDDMQKKFHKFVIASMMRVSARIWSFEQVVSKKGLLQKKYRLQES